MTPSECSSRAVFQNVFDTINPKTGKATYRADILEQQVGQWIQACPSTEGGHNWQAMSYHPGAGLLVIPLSQSCMEISGRTVALEEASPDLTPGVTLAVSVLVIAVALGAAWLRLRRMDL